MMRNPQHRILVISHAHPDFSLGGGEIAAYNLFKAYRQHEEVENAWFLARADRGRGAIGTLSVRRPNEYLWEQGCDWHSIKALHQESLTTWFVDLLRAIKPTVVHVHHYLNLGLEFLRVIKQVDPRIRIMMTLHEFLAICYHNGQMVKPGGFKLCSRETPDDCHRCFPHVSPEDFWLRKHYFMSHFKLVDQFVAPSEFLRQRYIEWGLPAERIVVIENGQSDEPALSPRTLPEGETRNRFGFFGQINPYKGLDVLLKALHEMPKKDRKKIVLEVHGANLEWHPKEFQDRVAALRDPLVKQGVVQWVGPYEPHELRRRMAGVDWIVVPSIWWENSPMVIQEAFVCGRPLLVSDIGGMAEKVKNDINGLHVPAGNVLQWGRALRRAATMDDARWMMLVEGIDRPLTYMACARAHLELVLQAPLRHVHPAASSASCMPLQQTAALSSRLESANPGSYIG